MAQRITFEKLTANGNGLGYWHDKAMFVPGPLPGETAWVKVTHEHARYSEGVLKRLPEQLPQRDQPAEEHYLVCSPWQNVNYAHQLTLKDTMLRDAFAKLDVTFADQIVGAPHATGYRNKLSFKIVRVDGKLELAIHQRGDDEELVIAPEGCALGSTAMNEAALAALTAIDQNLVTGSANLIVRQSISNGEISLVYADRGKVLWSEGPQQLIETIDGVELTYPWKAFFQVNPAAFTKALAYIREAVPEGSRVLDLYGGVGTIGLGIADRASKVVGVELQLDAVEQAEMNAFANRITKYQSVASASETLEDEFIIAADVVIVDPPRAGLDRALVDQFMRLKPARIIYLSCNPQTQARDLARLAEGYALGVVTGFDFYPGTLHLESLVVLDRR